ncbi:50S ribosomal protein L25/general stress protein Ctc [Salinarimonas ramus]|uniref:Large ribosomal subunit protein bL25 n=1 Tax=Salinarimonas ramus TaxID=690164 RepID=A0A917V2B7_9HYPH|nr:50S ribosomal protein L25/general stress protein Ctc [Salinarimonas ramus]GGK21293.1 50S ribosomal protein L25 [Salinarimonas ramus]
MSETKTLTAVARDRVGKGAAREARRQGRIPAVVYGAGKPPRAIEIDFNETRKLIYAGGFMTTMFDITVDGETEHAIPRDYQLDPVKDMPLHVDFFRVAKGQTVAVEVPVHFVNQEKAVGIKRGGTLNVVRHTVELNVPADKIPDAIEVDIATLDIGDSLHISAVTLPKGVTPVITDRDFTIATIAVPAGVREALQQEAAEKAESAGGEEEEG